MSFSGMQSMYFFELYQIRSQNFRTSFVADDESTDSVILEEGQEEQERLGRDQQEQQRYR